MPPTFSIRSFRSTSSNFSTNTTATTRTNTGQFELPRNYRHVVKQIHRNPPSSLPDVEATVHEVRYFLYMILTYADYKIAKRWPQWVLETCATWEGTGSDLRAMTDRDLLLLCPLDAGRASIAPRQKMDTYPPPDCRSEIGTIIAQTVSKLKGKEGEKARLEREWKETQLGQSARHRFHADSSAGFNTMEAMNHAYQPHLGSGAPSVISQQSYTHRPAAPSIYGGLGTGDLPFVSYSTPNLVPASVSGSIYPHLSCGSETGYQASDSSPTISGDGSNSSNNTHTTAKTTPPGSEVGGTNGRLSHTEIPRSHSTVGSLSTQQSYYQPQQQESEYFDMRRIRSHNDIGSRNMPPPPLSRNSEIPPVLPSPEFDMSRMQGTSYRPLSNSAPIPSIIYHAPPRPQSVQPSNSHHTLRPHHHRTSGSIRRIPGISRNSVNPQSVGSPLSTPGRGPIQLPPGSPANTSPSVHSQDTRGRGDGNRLADLPPIGLKDPRPGSPASSFSQRSYRPVEPPRPRPTVDSKSMSYPHPDISGPRALAPHPPNTASRRAVPSSLGQERPNPLEKTKVPVVSQFTSASRSATTAATDHFALEQGAYLNFKSQDSAERREVVRSEVERMAGMVPSNLRGEGKDPIGPSMRVMGPDGRPRLTLFEQIKHKEILDGKEQRGLERRGGVKGAGGA